MESLREIEPVPTFPSLKPPALSLTARQVRKIATRPNAVRRRRERGEAISDRVRNYHSRPRHRVFVILCAQRSQQCWIGSFACGTRLTAGGIHTRPNRALTVARTSTVVIARIAPAGGFLLTALCLGASDDSNGSSLKAKTCGNCSWKKRT